MALRRTRILPGTSLYLPRRTGPVNGPRERSMTNLDLSTQSFGGIRLQKKALRRGGLIH
jgi:hypothetical protein